MNRLFCLLLSGVLLVSATSCKKEKTGNEPPAGTIRINQHSENIRNVYFFEEPADVETGATVGLLILGPEGGPGAIEPEFYGSVEISEALFGSTIDLSRPLEPVTQPLPYLVCVARDGALKFTVDYDEDPIEEVVSQGSLKIDRQGDTFRIECSLTCSDGNQLQISWSGPATRVTAP